MSEEAYNRTLMEKIKKWFDIIGTVQIIFILLTISICPPAAILEIILLFVTSKKDERSVAVNIAGNIIISTGLIVYSAIRIFGEKTTSGVEVLLKLIDVVSILALVINLFIIYMSVRGLSYARDLQFLKQLDGYPYFFDRTDNGVYKPGRVSTSRNVNVEIKSFENNEFIENGAAQLKDTADSLFNNSFSDCIGFSKLLSMIIIIVDVFLGIIFSRPLLGVTCIIELFLLIFVLIDHESDKVIRGTAVHVIEAIGLFCLSPTDTVLIVPIILNLIQTCMYMAVIKKSIDMEEHRVKRSTESSVSTPQSTVFTPKSTATSQSEGKMLSVNEDEYFEVLHQHLHCEPQELCENKDKYAEAIHNLPDCEPQEMRVNKDEYVKVNGVYKKKLHVELKKKSELH